LARKKEMRKGLGEAAHAFDVTQRRREGEQELKLQGRKGGQTVAYLQY